MIAFVEPTRGKATAPLYQLRVVLDRSQPEIWRRLQVPGNANLGWLHAVLQVAMGWTNSHLHQFKIGKAFYSDPRHHFAEYEGDPEILDEQKARLQQLVPHEQDTFGYEYDFGDSWDHVITVEKLLPPPPVRATFAVCLDGARACPPEDCGGIYGYAELLKALKDRKHPEHRTLKAWLGRPFDAEAFEVAEANLWLRNLKWPRATEGHLRKVLLARLGYHR